MKRRSTEARRRSDKRSFVGRVFAVAETKQRIIRSGGRAHREAFASPKKELTEKRNRSAMARAMGVSRASLYYVAKQTAKDWALKVRMKETLEEHPSYGSRRLAIALGICRPRAQRVMRMFGIKHYRRRGRRYRKRRGIRVFPNLLLGTCPLYANHIWAADFTEMVHHGKKVYTATIIDLFTRQTMGVHVGTRKGSALTIQALANALLHHPPPAIFHSDNGREYEAKAFIALLEQ